jgi:hypothetical protein
MLHQPGCIPTLAFRVAPRALIEENGDFNYDKEKYHDMLLEAEETVLSFVGFNRTT